MNFASTLDQARDFLFLPADATAAEVWQTALDRRSEWQAKCQDPKAPALARSGASRKLTQLAPLLGPLEIEAALAVLEGDAVSPGPRIHQLRLNQQKLMARVAVLPENDERSIFSARLKSLDALLNQTVPPSRNPPVADPTALALGAKIDELRTALERNDGKARLMGMIETVRALSSVLRDEATRAEFAGQIAELTHRVDAILMVTTRDPFDPTPRFLTAKIAALRAAVQQRNFSRAPFLLGDARELAAELQDAAARAHAEDELQGLARQLDELASAVPPDPVEGLFAEKLAAIEVALAAANWAKVTGLLAEAGDLLARFSDQSAGDRAALALAPLAQRAQPLEPKLATDSIAANAVGEKINALRASLDVADLVRAAALSVEIRAMAAALLDPAARSRCESEAVSLTTRLQNLEEEARQADRAEQVVTAKLAALARADTAGLGKLIDELRPLVAGLARPSARTSAGRQLDEFVAQAQRCPDDAVRAVESGRVLRLAPIAEAQFTRAALPPLRFVAGPCFLLGREPVEGPPRADFLAPNIQKDVSRVHLTLQRKGEDIFVQDGHEKSPSKFGSKLDDEVLTPTPLCASFQRERSVVLGPSYSVRVCHVPGEAPGGPSIDARGNQVTAGRTVMISAINGAMKFTPNEAVTIPVVAIWLFTDATIGAAPACAVSLPQAGLADFHARVHYWEKGFWIENLRSGAAVRLGGRSLAKGEFLPLHSQDVLHLAQLAYQVVIDP